MVNGLTFPRIEWGMLNHPIWLARPLKRAHLKLPKITFGQTREGHVVLPSLSEGQKWDQWRFSEPGRLTVQELEIPLEGIPQERSILGVPTRELLSVPLWLNEVDETKFDQMIQLQLEVRGVKLGEGDRLFAWSVVARESSRTLVAATVLPAPFAGTLLNQNFQTYDAAVRYRSYPENALTLWLEQGRLCLACTRGGQVVYFQALTDGELNSAVISDIACIRASLHLQGVSTNLKEIVLWTKATPEKVQALGRELDLTIRSEGAPSPRTPEELWSFESLALVKLRSRKNGWQNWKQLFQWLCACYLMALIFLLMRVLVTFGQIQLVHWWFNDHEVAIDKVHQALTTWHYIAPAVNPSDYPLEVLLGCSSQLPGEAFHLTSFKKNEFQVVIQAEGRDLSRAVEFFNKIKTSAALSAYTWSMGQSRQLPGGITQIDITGIHSIQ